MLINPDRPTCPTDLYPLWKIGMRNGVQRWRCKICGYVPPGNPIGRPTIGRDSQSEYTRKYLDKLTPEQIAIRKAAASERQRVNRAKKKAKNDI
jgi:hypothetical protein